MPMSKASTPTKTTRGAAPVKKAAAARKPVELKTEYSTAFSESFQIKMSKARRASVNSSRGFVVPKLTGEEALQFMNSVGGFALPSRSAAGSKKKR